MSSLTERGKDEGQKLNSEGLMGSLQKINQVHYSTTSGENVLPSKINETLTPLLKKDKNKEGEASRDFRSSPPIFYGNQTPFTKLSSPSCSNDWYLESQHKSESVGQKHKFRRLRKLGDVCRKTSLECKKQTNVSPKRLAGSCFTANQTVNKKRRGTSNFSYFLFSSDSYLIVSYSIASLLFFYPILGILYLSRFTAITNFFLFCIAMKFEL